MIEHTFDTIMFLFLVGSLMTFAGLYDIQANKQAHTIAIHFTGKAVNMRDSHKVILYGLVTVVFLLSFYTKNAAVNAVPEKNTETSLPVIIETPPGLPTTRITETVKSLL